MNFFKMYFNTPKMPLSFYYTPFVVVYIFIFLIMASSGASLVSWILNIVLFILGSYTYAWLSDYMLATKDNFILRYFFTKSVVFRRDFGQILKSTHSVSKESRVYERRAYEFREKHSVYFKRTFMSIVINVVIKFILAWGSIFVFWISIFTHVIVMKKYRDFVDKEIEEGNL